MKAVLLLLVLTGCFYQQADMTDILKAEAFCADKGGINHINIMAVGFETVKCVNGNETDLDSYKLNNEG